MPENGIELAQVPPSSGAGSSFHETGQTDKSGHGDLAIDVRILQLSETIDHQVRASSPPPPPRAQIYRLPERVRAADRDAYEPRFLSFGPYYRGDSVTEEMRRGLKSKQDDLAFALLQLQGGGPPILEYIKYIASIESKARSCYSGDVAMEWDEFCTMLLHDGFQLIALLESFEPEEEEPEDAAATPDAQGHDSSNQEQCHPKTSTLISVSHDLMMVENQIPFFVVQGLYNLRAGDGGTGRKTVAEIAWEIIGLIMNEAPTASKCDEQCEHFVHLCHVYLKPSCLQVKAPVPGPGETSVTPGAYGRFRRATEYYEAGVKFRRWYDADAGANRPLLDVSFSNGVLRMAQHTVDDKTNYILRNVLAYEQCYHRSATSRDTSYVAAYVVFMSQLLSTPEDVALLSRRGVIEHMLGNDADVCAMFRGIADGVVFDPASEHYLKPIGVALQAHYKSRFHRWRAWVMRHRFGNPWLAAAWVFGATAVLGTIVQTVLAVLSYVNQGPTHKVAGPGI